ncbi:MAG: J domain-containing protein [Nitrospinae bacterium]|nr:J domain-containing protein [Nitrospinota bacterium]
MSSLTQVAAPEAEELKLKRQELNEMEQELTEEELGLSTLKAELHQFERLYNRVVGSRYAELDEVKAQILELAVRMYPRADGFRTEAEAAREQARQSAEEASEGNDDPFSPENNFNPTEDLKKLFREVAKKIHPDLTSDQEERDQRHELMSRLNEAYDRLDAESIRAILIEWEAGGHSSKHLGVGAQLVRTVRQIAQVRKRLRQIVCDFEGLESAEMYELKKNIEIAREHGKDLLQEMADDIAGQIHSIKNKVKNLIDELG